MNMIHTSMAKKRNRDKVLWALSTLSIFIPLSYAQMNPIDYYNGDGADLIVADLPFATYLDPLSVAEIKGYRAGGNTPLLLNGSVVVDYESGDVPRFVIGGYSASSKIATTANNSVVIKNGNISGNVWGVLASDIVITPDVDKEGNFAGWFDNSSVTSQELGQYDLQSNDNNVELEQAAVQNVYGGQALLYVKTGATKAGPSIGHSRAEGVIIIGNDSKLSANGNEVNILDTTTILGDIYGGQVSLNLETGDAVSGTVDSSDAGAGYTINSTFITLGAGFEATTSNNTVTINSALSSNSIVSGGDILVQLRSGQAGKEGSGSIINHSNADIMNGISQSYSNIVAERLILSASDNTVMINNTNSFFFESYGGRIVVSAHSGDIQSGSVILANPDSHIAKVTTYTNSYIVMPNATMLAEGNYLFVTGQSENLYGGTVQLSAISGNAFSGDAENDGHQVNQIDVNANANINVTNLNIEVQNNRVELRGSAEKVVGGQAAVTLQSGIAQAGKIETEVATQECPEENSSKECLKAYAYSEINAANGKIKADSNIVIIDTHSSVQSVKGGEVTFSVTGGKATSGSFNFVGRDDLTEKQIDSSVTINVSSTQLSANNNTVNFDGILENQGAIFGGYISFSLKEGEAWHADGSEGRHDINSNNTVVNATGNTVNLGDRAQITAGSQLYGGFLAVNGNVKPSSYDLFTGNTLNVTSKETLIFKDIGNFQYYNFTLTPILVNTNQAIIQTGRINFGTNFNNDTAGRFEKSEIHVVGIHSGDTILSEGDQFVLIQAEKGGLRGNVTVGLDQITQAQQGISLIYEVETIIDENNDRVITQIKKGSNKPNDGSNSVNGNGSNSGNSSNGSGSGNGSNGSGSGNSSNDSNSSNGDMHNPGNGKDHVKVNLALKSLHEGRMAMLQLLLRGADNVANNVWNIIGKQDVVEGYVPFADLYAGHSKYSSDSTIRANEYLLTAGVAFRLNQWTLVPLLEMGWSDYKGSSDYSGYLRSSGDNRYYGTGLLWRYDFDKGFYADGSFRIGRAHNEFESKDLTHAVTGERANYDIRGTYYGAHIGLGYLAEIDSANLIDFNAQFLWTKLQGKSLRVVGDPIDFDDLSSKRVRVGLEWKHQANDHLNMRAGVAYEYEFSDRDGLTTYHQFNVDGLSLKGSTGIVNLGATLKPSDRSRWSYDVDVMGYVGKRKGVALNLKANYEF